MKDLESSLRRALSARADLVTGTALRPASPPRPARRRIPVPVLPGLAVAAAVLAVVVALTAGSAGPDGRDWVLLPSLDPLAGGTAVSAAGWVGTVPQGWSAVVVDDVDPETSTACLSSADGSCRVALSRTTSDPWDGRGPTADLSRGRSYECAGRSSTPRTLVPSGRRGYLVTSACTIEGAPAELVRLVVPQYGLTAAAFRRPDDPAAAELVTALLERLDVAPGVPRVELEELTCDELPELCPGRTPRPSPFPTS